MLTWRNGGYSTHNEVSVAASDAEGRKKLAGYMLRAPLSLQKMTYDAATGTVSASASGWPARWAAQGVRSIARE